MNNTPEQTTVMETEPAVVIATVIATVTALIALLVAFGLDITDEQRNAILGIVSVLAPVVAGFVIRGSVFSPNTVDDEKASSYLEGVDDTQNGASIPKSMTGY